MAQDSPLDKPLQVGQPVRLAITPILDGKLDSEEWDVLAQSELAETFFQWEPETLYWAARTKAGQDVVFSYDANADGWLVGDDNLEFRVTFDESQPSVTIRRLSGTDPNGPKWVDANVVTESVKVMASQTNDSWEVECSYTPPGTESPQEGKRVGVRVDVINKGESTGEPFVPRVMSFVNLQFDMGMNLPSGFSWKPDFLVRSVPVDDSFKVKYGFKRTEKVDFSQVDYRAEGFAKPLMAAGTKPFPEWDKKGHIGENYATIIASNAPVGYRVLRLTLTGTDKTETVLRSSFRIAELVDFDAHLPSKLSLDPEARIIRGSVDLRSNGLKRINGLFNLKTHDSWTATRGKSTPFVIYRSRGVAKIPVELIVPKDCVGVFPLTFTVTIGDKVITKTKYIPVGQP